MIEFSGKRILTDLEEAPDVAYQDVLKKFDPVWCVKGLIVIRKQFSGHVEA